MKIMSSAAFLIVISFVPTKAQKLNAIEGHIQIDTVITTPKTKDQAFNSTKGWLIQNLVDYKNLAQGEVPGELISTKAIVKYWAAMGTKQAYIQDINITFTEGQIKIKLDNLKTYVEGQKGWTADKFFTDSEGKLKPKYDKWYSDVELKFKELSSGIGKAAQ